MFSIKQMIANDIDLWFRIAYKYPNIIYNPKPTAIYHSNIENSISKKYKYSNFKQPFLIKHMQLSKENNCLPDFEPCAKKLLSTWTLSMFFQKRNNSTIKNLMQEFPNLYKWHQIILFKLLQINPSLTVNMLHCISTIVRSLPLKTEIVSKPER